MSPILFNIIFSIILLSLCGMNEEEQDNMREKTTRDNRQESKLFCLAGSATHWHLELFNEDRTDRRTARKGKLKDLNSSRTCAS